MRLSLPLLARAPRRCLDRGAKESSQAARRRAAGSPSPALLLPQLRWIGEGEEVVFHRMCAKPARRHTWGAHCRAAFVNIKSAIIVEPHDRRDLEVAS